MNGHRLICQFATTRLRFNIAKPVQSFLHTKNTTKIIDKTSNMDTNQHFGKGKCGEKNRIESNCLFSSIAQRNILVILFMCVSFVYIIKAECLNNNQKIVGRAHSSVFFAKYLRNLRFLLKKI